MSTTSGFCPSCGKPIAPGARFCPSCGATVVAQPAPPVWSAPQYQPPYPPAPNKSNTLLIIAIVLIVVVVAAVIGGILLFAYFAPFSTTTNHSLNMVNGLITVQPGYYNYYFVTVPSGASSVVMNGTFTASGGSGNNIEVLVMDQTNYVNWQNGNQATSYYDSGQVTTGTISANLPGGGTCYLVYSNTFSSVASKNVQTTANVYYQG
jgi:hypothetical protein